MVYGGDNLEIGGNMVYKQAMCKGFELKTPSTN
jgi:hypothetical protein